MYRINRKSIDKKLLFIFVHIQLTHYTKQNDNNKIHREIIHLHKLKMEEQQTKLNYTIKGYFYFCTYNLQTKWTEYENNE